MQAKLQHGIELYESENYEEAFQELLPLAQKGNAVAQSHIGVMYRSGYGTEKNREEALKWFIKSAQQGHDFSGFMAGIVYCEVALEYFDKSAQQGSDYAKQIADGIRKVIYDEDDEDGKKSEESDGKKAAQSFISSVLGAIFSSSPDSSDSSHDSHSHRHTKTYEATIRFKNNRQQKIRVQADNFFSARDMIEAQYGKINIVGTLKEIK